MKRVLFIVSVILICSLFLCQSAEASEQERFRFPDYVDTEEMRSDIHLFVDSLWFWVGYVIVLIGVILVLVIMILRKENTNVYKFYK